MVIEKKSHLNHDIGDVVLLTGFGILELLEAFDILDIDTLTWRVLTNKSCT